MADKSEWKTPSMESEGKGDGHQYGRKPRTPEWETHLVRKRWDIGLLRALSLQIMMMMMMMMMKMMMMMMMIIYTYRPTYIQQDKLPAFICQGYVDGKGHGEDRE